MKKIIAALLCLCLLCAGAAIAEAESAEGTWYAVSLVTDDASLNAADIG